jgi:hypothetical protein
MEKALIIIGIVAVIAVLIAAFMVTPSVQPSNGSNQQETQENQQETENEDAVCTATGGESMSLSQAKEIALASDCGDRLEQTAVCNSGTGTWWIDMSVSKPGCSPACVVNIETAEAEINWRCTGLNP